MRSIEMLKTGKVAYEFRTTVVPSIVQPEDIICIGEVVKGATVLALQQFIPTDILNKKMQTVRPYAAQTIKDFAEALQPYVGKVIIRI
jgi:pyruvate formate lyase activating enzyme